MGRVVSYNEDVPRCTFCGKTEHQVRKLVAGPNASICDECIACLLYTSVRYREIPVPSTLADYGIGVEFEAGERALGDAFSAGLGSDAESRIATGWIMMLYAHELRIDWDSNWRCVAFARLPLETAENDSLTPGMYWDDMCDYFDGIEPDSVSGTVTVTQNTAFGSMAGSTSAGCEIRVSWTPLDGTGPDGTMDAGAQVRSWAAFIRSTIRFEEDDAS